MARKTDKRQNPGARSVRRGLGSLTSIDKRVILRIKLVKRLTAAGQDEKVPIKVLQHFVETLEMWGDDKEE